MMTANKKNENEKRTIQTIIVNSKLWYIMDHYHHDFESLTTFHSNVNVNNNDNNNNNEKHHSLTSTEESRIMEIFFMETIFLIKRKQSSREWKETCARYNFLSLF